MAGAGTIGFGAVGLIFTGLTMYDASLAAEYFKRALEDFQYDDSQNESDQEGDGNGQDENENSESDNSQDESTESDADTSVQPKKDEENKGGQGDEH